MGHHTALRRFLALSCALVATLLVAPHTRGSEPRARRPRAPASQLEVERTVRVGNAVVTRYAQRVGGFEVLGAEAVVNDPDNAPARLLTDSTVEVVKRPSEPRISRSRAVKIAVDAARVHTLRDKTTANLAIAPRDGGTLVWRVRMPSLDPLADLETLVDARTGRPLRTDDLLRRDTGVAQIFDPNPVVAQDGYAGLMDRRDHDSPLLTSLRTPVVLERIDPGGKCLRGEFAEVRLHRNGRRVCRDALDWSAVTRSSDSFEALMAYFHIDRTRAYIEALDLDPIFERRQVVLANSFHFDNAFYSPWNNRIELGSGGVDDGEDADIIVHEYGHAIQDAQVPGFGRSLSAGSMGEGFGDYLAAAMSAELSGGTHENNVCLFDWDGVSWSPKNPPCGRRADDPRTITELRKKPRCREVHCLGQAWSSALYGLRLLLGDDGDSHSVMDRVVIDSHFLLGRSASFRKGAEALECADENLYPSGTPGDCRGEHYAAIHAEMVLRGFLN